MTRKKNNESCQYEHVEARGEKAFRTSSVEVYTHVDTKVHSGDAPDKIKAYGVVPHLASTSPTIDRAL